MSQEMRLCSRRVSLVALLLLRMNTSECMCAFVCFAMLLLCVFLERVPRVCERGVPQRHTVKIILKFGACVENQGISPSLLMQVLSGFLLKRCLGIRNGRGAFSYSLLTHPLTLSRNDGAVLWREVLLHFRQSRKEHSMNR